MICSTTYRTVLSLVGSLALTLGTFGMLQASAWDAPHSRVVGYHTADLARPAGAARIYHRIQVAAERVCGPGSPAPLSEHSRYLECVNQAVANAVTDINHPQLTALHSATMRQWQAANAQSVKPQV